MSSIFDNLIGQRINQVLIGNDHWTLVIRTNTGKFFRYDTANDCCNSVFINHMTGLSVLGDGNVFDLLRGALVTGAEDKEWTENREEGIL